MPRLQRRGLPLVLTVVGNSIEADLPVGPRLCSRPFDAAGEILRLSQRPDVDYAGRAASPTAVDADADISVGNPFFRVDNFPALILIGRIRGHVGVIGAHPIPLRLVEIL